MTPLDFAGYLVDRTGLVPIVGKFRQFPERAEDPHEDDMLRETLRRAIRANFNSSITQDTASWSLSGLVVSIIPMPEPIGI